MSVKIVLIYCTSALLIQMLTAQCLRNPITSVSASPIVADLMPLTGPCNGGLVANNGGGLTVTSASPMAPIGLVVTSDNAMEGAVAVGGQLPLLGSVAMDAVFNSAGAGAISYGCGDGSLGIISEGSLAPESAVLTDISNAASTIGGLPAMATGANNPVLMNPTTAEIAITNAAPAFVPPILGSSFSFGPGKSPFAVNAPKSPSGRGCGFRY